jgi:hypothetical protein
VNLRQQTEAMQVDATDYGPELLPPESAPWCSRAFPTSRIFPQAVIPMPGMVACPPPPPRFRKSRKNAQQLYCTRCVEVKIRFRFSEQTSRGDQRLALYGYDPGRVTNSGAIVIVPRLMRDVSNPSFISIPTNHHHLPFCTAQYSTSTSSKRDTVHLNRYVLKYVQRGTDSFRPRHDGGSMAL